MQKTPGHVCGHTRLRINQDSHNIARITSDCRPWQGKYFIGTCQKCGVVQTLVDKKWRADCEKIYRDYLIYPQTVGRAEQKIFSPTEHRLLPRSEAIVSHLREKGFFRGPGDKVLEIGAGAGFLLEQISRVRRNYRLFAVEKSPDCVAKIRSLPKVQQIFPSLLGAPSGFDKILLIHTLEHISEPVGYLQVCRRKLTPSGLLFIQVPNSESNPFLLAVADHCSHFTLHSLKGCLEKAGFQSVHLAKIFGGKEIAGIFRPTDKHIHRKTCRADSGWLSSHVSKLRVIRNTFIRAKKPVALFGTSLGATWVLSQFKRKILGLLDEDPARVGKKFMSLKIQHPSSLAATCPVFSTVPFTRSNKLKHKLRRFRKLNAC